MTVKADEQTYATAVNHFFFPVAPL